MADSGRIAGMFWKKRIYLDYAAGVSGNPSSPHEEGRRSQEQLEGARKEIARLVEVQADDVVFTGGATEANALAMLGHVRALKAGGAKDIHMLYLPSAHASLVENAKLLASEGVAIEPLPIKDCRVDIRALAKMVRAGTALVSMDAVCGETGVVWNTRAVAEQLRTSRSPDEKRILLHVDASQAPPTQKITCAHFGADMLTLDASKVSGVRGIGALVAHRTIPLVPLYEGGGQERGLRSGSEAYELAQRFAAALRTAALGREQFHAAAEVERAKLVSAITAAIPNVYINEGRGTGPPAGRQAPNILNISLPGRDTDYLVALMDEAGFAVSTRSACETDSQEGSRAVLALFGDPARARATLRMSWGPDIRTSELIGCARELARAVAFIDSNGQG